MQGQACSPLGGSQAQPCSHHHSGEGPTCLDLLAISGCHQWTAVPEAAVSPRFCLQALCHPHSPHECPPLRLHLQPSSGLTVILAPVTDQPHKGATAEIPALDVISVPASLTCPSASGPGAALLLPLAIRKCPISSTPSSCYL